MRTTRLLLLVLTLLVLFSLPPTSSGQASQAARGVVKLIGNKKFWKGVKFGWKLYNKSKEAADALEDPEVASSTEENAPTTLNDMYEAMFIVQFSVGSPPEQVTAVLGLGSWITSIKSTNLFTTKKSLTCCSIKSGAKPQCPAASCQSFTRGYTLVSGTFSFDSTINITSYFMVARGSTNSILSFSRSQYSVLQNFRTRRFSYFFPLNREKNASLFIGEDISTTGLHSTKLVNSTDEDYSHRYFVNLTQIAVGKKSVQINPQLDLTNGVFLDAIIPATLLAQPAYEKVKSTIVDQMGEPKLNTGTNELELCYANSSNWPDLILSFSENSGDVVNMVLKKQNYVVTEAPDYLDCAAILPVTSEEFSVIGAMAQLDRKMVFDDEQSLLFFDQYPDTGSTTASKANPTILSDNLAMFSFFSVVLVILCA